MYNVIAGDTLDSISIQRYGHAEGASNIADANPGIADPPEPGTRLIIPPQVDAPLNVPQKVASVGENEVSVSVGGRRFRFWENVRITRALDSVYTVSLTAPFKHDAEGFSEIFEPFAYKDLNVSVGGERLFTGTAVTVKPTITPKSKTITLSGYSTPGVLMDCPPPKSAFPLEFDGVSLREIATKVCATFGIKVIFEADAGAVFRLAAIAPGEKIWPFLTKLAQQRNLVMASDADGALVFRKSVGAGNPVARFKQGEVGIRNVEFFSSPQSYYSSITGMPTTVIGAEGSATVVPNGLLQGVNRPMTYKHPDTGNTDVVDASKAKMGRMFGNVASWVVDIPTWRDPQGDLWEENTTISLYYPDALILKEFEFVIRSVDMVRNVKGESAKMNVVLPGSFSGETPTEVPWVL